MIDLIKGSWRKHYSDFPTSLFHYKLYARKRVDSIERNPKKAPSEESVPTESGYGIAAHLNREHPELIPITHPDIGESSQTVSNGGRINPEGSYLPGRGVVWRRRCGGA